MLSQYHKGDESNLLWFSIIPSCNDRPIGHGNQTSKSHPKPFISESQSSPATCRPAPRLSWETTWSCHHFWSLRTSLVPSCLAPAAQTGPNLRGFSGVGSLRETSEALASISGRTRTDHHETNFLAWIEHLSPLRLSGGKIILSRYITITYIKATNSTICWTSDSQRRKNP